jgi:hypothetical protein
MTRKRIAVLTLASLAGVAAVTLIAYLYHQAEVERQRHSWSVQITPTGGETTVIQLDMRESHGKLKRQLLEALLPLLDDAPAPDGPETVLGTFQCECSVTESREDMTRLYRDVTGARNAMVTVGHTDRFPPVQLIANRPGETPWVACRLIDGRSESPIIQASSAETLVESLAHCYCQMMRCVYEALAEARRREQDRRAAVSELS